MSQYPDPYGYSSSGSVKYAVPPKATSAYQDPSFARPPVVQAPIPQYAQSQYAPPPVVQAPIPQYAQSQYGYPPRPAPTAGAWTTGLCGCCEDCASCFIGHWCPCVLVGKNVEAIDEGRTTCATGGLIFLLLHLFTGFGCVYTCLYRTRLREKYGIPGDPVQDFCVDFWCLCCSICQVYRELENRHALTPGYGYPAGPASAPSQQYMTR